MRHIRLILAGCWAAVLALSTVRAATPAPRSGAVDFNRDIRPILADNCFACHGPDEQARKAGLRLDIKAGALQPLKGGRQAVVPGEPARSALLARVTTADPDDVMPPPKTGKKLRPEQIQRLKDWIAAGADWPEHWAFVRPQPPTPPAVKNTRWPRNDLDRFVLHRLEREGLRPAPEADRTTLARRATLDLTGLPPTIEEVDAFLADKRPDAYERLVDRLLSSPRYGEHMAKHWLDAVRYADSHGYHIDAQRDIWAYREWVIRAFNANQPFDRFTIEQLAGDLLPNPTSDQKIATGYIRSNMSTGEGGAIEAEYAAKYAFDRVETTGTTWMGLTLTCARCHTHKYDPITQREYYGLFAIFNQLDEPVMDGNKPNPDPFLKLPSPEQTGRLAWLKERITDARKQLDAPSSELDASLQTWAKAWNERLADGWRALAPASAKSAKPDGASLTPLEDQSVLAGGARPETDVYEVTFKPAGGPLAALRLEALPHESLPKQGSSRAEDGRFQLSEFEAELVPPAVDAKPQKLSFAQTLADRHEAEHDLARALDAKPETGWLAAAADGTAPQALFLLAQPVTVPADASLRVRLRFETGKESRAIGRFRISAAQGETLVAALNPARLEPWWVLGPLKSGGLAAGFAQVFEPETRVDLAKRYAGVREEVGWQERGDLSDGGTHLLVNELHGVHGVYYLFRRVHVSAPTGLDVTLRADDVFKVWVNDRQVAGRGTPEPYPGVRTRFRVDLAAGENRLLIKLVNHQGAKHFAFSPAVAGQDVLAPDVAAVLSVAAQAAGDWGAKVRDWHRRQYAPEFRDLMDKLAGWREEEAAIDTAIPTTLIARELTQPRETRLLNRGEYDQPGEVVSPGVPAILPPWPAGAPTNRLGLAQWLVSPEHPLTARVTVNRVWQQHFGVGLVKTTEDFGVQGERPSHPELLDWLATQFIRSGWDVKHLQRLILASATYRQAARAPADLLARDPENRLLARGPRFRLEAEVMRDAALFAGGLLVEQLGGRSVKPYEPPGLWEAVSFNNSQKYVPDEGEARYRRSLYTYWKRQSPPPNMLIFDAPTREYCVVRRPRTNTPLQALVLLNDPHFVEAARALAQRMLLEGGADTGQRLALGFRVATARRPARAEVQILREVLRAQLAVYRADPAAAEALLGVGDFKAREGLDPAELAAWTTIASMILNLDETLTKG
jgi:mono/diheme cytochrome c family protein